METSQAKKYLLDKKEDFRKITVFPRFLSFISTSRFITTVIGPRRAGKTYALYGFIKKNLSDEDFLLANFEDVDLSGISPVEAKELISIHAQLYKKNPRFLFLDEIQALAGWQKLVLSLYESKQFIIFLSGSSSRLLSKEIATSLRGRSLSHLVLPLSFAEFLVFQGIHQDLEKLSSTQENKLLAAFERYVDLGGFPDIVLEPERAEQFLRDYFDVVVYRDIIERFQVQNTGIVRFLMQAALSSFSSVVSVHRIFQTAKSKNLEVSKKTLYTYMNHLEESFFVFLLKKFSFSARESASSLPKLYLNDVGLRNVLHSASSEKGKSYENIVFLELKRRQNEHPLQELFYYRIQPHDYEVDFVVKEKSSILQLIQVVAGGGEEKEREVRALLLAGRDLNCKNLLVLTEDKEGEKTIHWHGVKGRVRFLPVWKWLLRGDVF
ncbi:ATP-binding protein [Candidatus Woesearchaeota archaeon]|nr:ATP-binding protein [Candidatus Woesearchaeota archaeon]